MQFIKLLLVLILTGLHFMSMSQCTINPIYTQSGIYPEIIPPADEGVAYAQVIDFVFIKDTVYQGLNITVDSVHINKIIGMPDSFKYEFDKPYPTYPGGGHGCVLFSGTPQPGSARTYLIEIDLTAYFFLFNNVVAQNAKDTVYFVIRSKCSAAFINSSPGVYPNSLPVGYELMHYKEILTFVFKKDTIINSDTIKVDSVKIISVSGLPTGFNYYCSDSACTDTGGGNECLTIEGDPVSGMKGFSYIVIGLKYFLNDSLISTVQETYNDTLLINFPLGAINELLMSKGFEVFQNFPNPFSDMTEINIVSEKTQNLYIKVFDLLGKLVYYDDVQVHPGLNKQFINASGFKEGIYSYVVSDGFTIRNKMMIVVKSQKK